MRKTAKSPRRWLGRHWIQARASSPFFGRPALVWLVNAGGFGIVIAYLMVAISFLVLRRREPEPPRPYRAPLGTATGYIAIVLSIALKRRDARNFAERAIGALH